MNTLLFILLRKVNVINTLCDYEILIAVFICECLTVYFVQEWSKSKV